MNWKERLLEAIVEEKQGSVTVTRGTGSRRQHLRTARVGTVTLRSGKRRTAMLGTPEERGDFTGPVKHFAKRGPVRARTVTTDGGNTTTTVTDIEPADRTKGTGKRTTQTTQRGADAPTTKHTERRSSR